MGKITNEMPELMKTAMKAKDKDKLQTLRNIKAKFIEFKTSPDGIKKLVDGEITDTDEINTINKMIKERKKDIETYGNRQDLITEANTEITILESFVPQAATEADVRVAIVNYIEANGEFTQRDMGAVVKYVKSQFTNVDGKMVATIVKSYIK